MSIMQTAAADYVFGGDQNELERLLTQAADLRPESEWLLNEIAIREGSRVADVGCGPIGILDLLSQRVGPTGQVVGIEREPRFVAMAEAEIAKRGLHNTSIVLGDALAPQLERGSFDFVHERLVLINMPIANQLHLVSEMATLARPGGIVATESWDRASHVCFPDHPSWDVLNSAYRDAVRATNGDGTTGRTLPSLLRSAGLFDIRVKVHVRAVENGDPRRTHRLGILEVAKPKILGLGRFSASEFDKHRNAVADHLNDPNTLLIDQLFVQAWGTKVG
jgi:SAM-dependent methyltransferase